MLGSYQYVYCVMGMKTFCVHLSNEYRSDVVCCCADEWFTIQNEINYFGDASIL